MEVKLMQEGIYFPQFWQPEYVEHWINHFINSRLVKPINYHSATPAVLPVDWLRQLYINQHNDFLDLVQLFKLFGIKVKVSKNQGLFNNNNDGQANSVIVDTKNINVQQLCLQHPLLDGLADFEQLLTYDCLFGLVLDYLININPAITMESLLKLCHEYQISVKTPLEIDFSASESKIIKKSQTNKRVEKVVKTRAVQLTNISMARTHLSELKTNKNKLSPNLLIAKNDISKLPVKKIFNKKSYRSLVHSLNKSGIITIDQLTRKNLETIALSLNFNHKKLKKILELFDKNQLKTVSNGRDTNQQFPVKKVPRSTIETKSEELSQAIIKEDQSVFLPLLPIPENIFKNKSIISLSDYQTILNSYFRNSKLNQHFVHLEGIAEKLTKIINTNFEEKISLPSADMLRKSLKIEFGEVSHYGQDCEDQLLQRSWLIQEKLVPMNKVKQYIKDFWNTFDDNTLRIVNASLEEEIDTPKIDFKEIDVRDTYRDFSKYFVQWWQAMGLTNKLLIKSKCNGIKLDDEFDSKISLLILREIVANNQDLKNLWT